MHHNAISADSADLQQRRRPTYQRAVPPRRSEPDALFAARTRGVAIKGRLAHEAGGLLSPGDAAAALGIDPAALDRLRAEGGILALPTAGHLAYPAILAREGPVPGLPSVLHVLRGVNPWVVLDLLMAPDTTLSGRSLLDALRDGDTQAAIQVAAAYGPDAHE